MDKKKTCRNLFLIAFITLLLTSCSFLIYTLFSKNTVRSTFVYHCTNNSRCDQQLYEELKVKYYDPSLYQEFDLAGEDIRDAVHFSLNNSIITLDVTNHDKTKVVTINDYILRDMFKTMGHDPNFVLIESDWLNERILMDHLLWGSLFGIFVSLLLLSSDFKITFNK